MNPSTTSRAVQAVARRKASICTRSFTRPRVRVHKSAQVRPYGSAVLDATEYQAAWTNVEIYSAEPSYNERAAGWVVSNFSDNSQDEAFDPILDIRAINPLIFENNYELEEYGPSFAHRDDHNDNHDRIIREWRIRNEEAA